MKLKVICGIGLVMAVLFFSCQSDTQLEYSRYYTGGSVIYKDRCQNCHGADGQGLLALIPPLTDAAYLKQNKTSLACITKYGLKNKMIIVANKPFDGAMPATDLAPIDVAKVLTYVTNSFGNKGGTITSQQVVADLKNCK